MGNKNDKINDNNIINKNIKTEEIKEPSKVPPYIPITTNKEGSIYKDPKNDKKYKFILNYEREIKHNSIK